MFRLISFARSKTSEVTCGGKEDCGDLADYRQYGCKLIIRLAGRIPI